MICPVPLRHPIPLKLQRRWLFVQAAPPGAESKIGCSQPLLPRPETSAGITCPAASAWCVLVWCLPCHVYRTGYLRIWPYLTIDYCCPDLTMHVPFPGSKMLLPGPYHHRHHRCGAGGCQPPRAAAGHQQDCGRSRQSGEHGQLVPLRVNMVQPRGTGASSYSPHSELCCWCAARKQARGQRRPPLPQPDM